MAVIEGPQTYAMKLRPLTPDVVESLLREAYQEAAAKFVKIAMGRVRRGKLETDCIHAAVVAALQSKPVVRTILAEVDDSILGWTWGEDLTETIWGSSSVPPEDSDAA